MNCVLYILKQETNNSQTLNIDFKILKLINIYFVSIIKYRKQKDL